MTAAIVPDFPGALLRGFRRPIEYVKTIARWLRRDGSGVNPIWKGHARSVREILRKSAMILPNSAAEARRLQEEEYQVDRPDGDFPAGVDPCVPPADLRTAG